MQHDYRLKSITQVKFSHNFPVDGEAANLLWTC